MIESLEPYRALVCGSNYGRVYLDALRGHERVRPAALLANGSRRSRLLAREHGLQLYGSVKELPSEIELACAALPSSADEVVVELLERGIAVLCEHPRSSAFVARAFEIAERSGTTFQVNGHFGDLPAAGAFSQACQERSAASPPRFVEVTAQERSLYAALDILDRAWQGLEALEVEGASSRDDSATRSSASVGWVRVFGKLAKAPVDFRIQVPPARPPDGSPIYWVDLRLTVGFDEGVLSLLSLAGPVVWNQNLARAAKEDQGLWDWVGGSSASSRGPSPVELRRAREEANRMAITRMLRVLEGAKPEPVVSQERLLALARAWEHVSEHLRS